MSFDTDKRKLRKIWEDSQDRQHGITQAVLTQDKKERIIAFAQPNMVNLGNLGIKETGWQLIELKAKQSDGSSTVQGATFSIAIIIPESSIPFANLEVAYKFTGNIGLEDNGNRMSLMKFSQVEDATPKNEFGLPEQVTNLKKVTWYIALTIEKSYNGILNDILVNFYFTLMPRM